MTWNVEWAGALERVDTDTSAPLRLRVTPYVVRLSVDRASRVIYVWAVWRSG
jgi:hypothetical protein